MLLSWAERGGHVMELISERITNISELENKISSARCNTNNIEKSIKEKNYKRAEELIKILSLQMHKLDCFELCIEHRKIHYSCE